MGNAAIALGGNLGDPTAAFAEAARRFSAVGRVVAKSALYETPPLGPPQPTFLNAVLLLDTPLEPEPLLDVMLTVERALGRVRREKWGPRTLDLDLVAYDERALSTPRVTVPHPEAHRRAFVLVPLAEVAPERLLPGRGRVRDLLAALPPGEISAVVRSPRPW